MPEIGETKRGRELGYRDKKHNYIWCACLICGKERWVKLKNGEPRSLNCNQHMKGRKLTTATKLKLSIANKGELSHNWKGDMVRTNTGRVRAISWYPLQPCEVCGSLQSQHHHKDGNTLNNKLDNIAFLCCRHHMETDGRIKQPRNNNGQFKVKINE